MAKNIMEFWLTLNEDERDKLRRIISYHRRKGTGSCKGTGEQDCTESELPFLGRAKMLAALRCTTCGNFNITPEPKQYLKEAYRRWRSEQDE